MGQLGEIDRTLFVMKKLLIIFLFSLFSFNAMAIEKINVIKHSRPGGLIDRLNEIIALSLGERFGEFIQVPNCVAAKKIIENSTTPILTAWPTERQAVGQPCKVDDKFFISTYSNSPYHITYFAGNDKASDINYLLTGEIKIGVWDSAFWYKPQSQFILDMNPKAKVIRYKSKPFRTALASGEIDYKMVSFPGDDPVIAILDGQGLMKEHKFSNMGYSLLLFGNIDFDIREIYESDAWEQRRDVTHKAWLKGKSKGNKLQKVNKLLKAISE